MKKIVKRIIIFSLIIGIAVLGYYKCKTVFAASSEFPASITYNPAAGDFSAPFAGSAFTDGGLTYCRKHGKHLKSAWGRIVYKRNNDEDLTFGDRLAKVLYEHDNNTRQDIIWYLNKTHRDYIEEKTGIKLKVYNTGTKTIESTRIEEMIIKGMQYKPAESDPNIKIDISDVKNETQTIDGTKYCVFTGIKIKIGKLGTDGEAYLNALVNGEAIDTYKIDDKTGKVEKCPASKGREFAEEKIGTSELTPIKVLVKEADIKNAKKIKITINGNYNIYSGNFAKYTYSQELSSRKDIQDEVQDMLRLKVDKKAKDISEAVSIDIEKAPRIITTKYIQSIKRADGTEVKITGDGGLAENNEALKPRIEVHLDENVDSTSRYDLQPQNLEKGNIKVNVGDTITYMIRVYNVGEETVNLAENKDIQSEREQKVGEKTGKGSGPIVVIVGNVEDHYDNDHLELVGDTDGIWEQTKNSAGESYYYTSASNLTNNGKIKSYAKDLQLSDWSSYIKIQFKVKSCGKDNCKITSIRNNGHEVPTGDTPKIVTTKYVQSITHADGSVTQITGPGGLASQPGKEYLNPSIKFNEAGGYELTQQELKKEDVEIKVGDTLTYAIKVYNVGDETVDIEKDKIDSIDDADGDGSGPKVVKDGKVYDFYDTNSLEFIGSSSNWTKGNEAGRECYYATGSKLSNGGVIKSHKETNKEEEYSSEISIQFKVKNYSEAIKNNAHIIPPPQTNEDRLITTKHLISIIKMKKDGTYDTVPIPTRPSVTVNDSEPVKSDRRYNLIPQRISKAEYEINPGDILVYNIDIWNVGNREVDLTDTSLRSDPEQKPGEGPGHGTGPVVLENGQVHDYYDPEVLKLRPNGYREPFAQVREGLYVASTSALSKTIIQPKEYADIAIGFEVLENNKDEITNNGHIITKEDEDPRLITTKQVTNIECKYEDDKTNFPSANCNVYTDQSIYSNERYNLSVQDTSNIKASPGDIITYEIIVYNIGNKTANLGSDTSLKSEPEQRQGEGSGQGTGPVVVENGEVHDYFDTNNLEFYADDAQNASLWTQNGSGCYVASASNLQNPNGSSSGGNIISAQEDGAGYWVKIPIKFIVKDSAKKDDKFTNNGNEATVDGVPRLVTTKQLKTITHPNGTKVDVTGNLANKPGKENLKATIEVHSEELVSSSNRYNLKPQDLSKDINVMKGDKLTYEIIVYNVGTKTAEVGSWKKLKSDPEPNGNIVVQDCKVYDFYDTTNLRLTSRGNWTRETKDGKACYSANANRLSNGGTIKSYGESPSAYSESITIEFEVIGEGKDNIIKIVNNNNTVTGNDKQTVKYVAAYYSSTSGTKHYQSAPKIQVDTSKEIGEEGRVKITVDDLKILDDITAMNGDTITYGIRYYSTATNSIQLSWAQKDFYQQKGLKFKYASTDKQGNQKTLVNQKGNYIEIPPQNIVLEGYSGSGPVPYIDIFLTFEVDVPLDKDGKQLTSITMLQNNIDPDYIPRYIPVGWEISGNVFIDKKDYASGKVTIAGNKMLDSGDIPVVGMQVELFEYKDGAVIRANLTSDYKNTTTTDENGYYEFKGLRNKIDLPIKYDPAHYYFVKFTYNGQEFENVTYNVDNFGGKGSYALENDHEDNRDLRKECNDNFPTIDSSNSTNVSLRDEARKQPTHTSTNGFKISAYTKGLIGPSTSHKAHVNLGIVRREFDLELENKLDSLDISINGVNQHVTSKNGGTIKYALQTADLKELNQDVYFKTADYKTDEIDDELSVWVNYIVTVRNVSKDNFIGVLNSINFYCNGNFDKIEINRDRIIDIGSENQFQKINIPASDSMEGITNIYYYADGNELNFDIRLHLSRATIENIIKNPDDEMKTLETLAEIESYGTKYNGDIYQNGHGSGWPYPNAGKIDEDSNAGNLDMETYVSKIRKSKEVSEIINFFAEDDASRALGIVLREDNIKRKLTGKVFEDFTQKTDIGEKAATRLGNGRYEEGSGDKPIDNVKVELLEKNGEEYTLAEAYEFTNEVFSKNDGEYVFEGFIPSPNYVVRFTYGFKEDEKNALSYNAQDYKSTIDKTKNNYNPPTLNGINAPDAKNDSSIEHEYWYTQVKDYSVAKDENIKMNEDELTYKRATELEEYERYYEENKNEAEEDFTNTAITKPIFAPIRTLGESKEIYKIDADYVIGNINLGLAERPRSELQLEKEVDHINITASDGTTLVDGSSNPDEPKKSLSWTDRYVQPIIDKNLIYGATLSVTYKYTVKNTGEIDYFTGNEYAQIDDRDRMFYDFGEKLAEEDIVTTTPTLVDYVDNKLEYESTTIIYNGSKTNANFWDNSKLSDNEKENEELFDPDGKDGRKYFSTVIKSKTLDSIKPGGDPDITYLTLTRKLPNAELEDQLTYNNFAEILISTNKAGRRNYSTKGETTLLSDNSDNRGKVKINDIEDIINIEKNGDDYILSIPGNIPGEIAPTDDYISNDVLHNTPGEKPWLTLAQYLGGEYKGAISSLDTGEPDSAMAQEIQIIPPFGDQTNYNTIIWVAIITTSAIIIGAGIYIIKKKVL